MPSAAQQFVTPRQVRAEWQPFSRRSFVTALSAGGGALALWPRCLRARGGRLPPISLIVVSDTHLGYRDQPRAGELWERTAAEIAAAEGELVVHLGDVVDGGREAQYPLYLETRRRINKPVYEIPGNHDPQELFEKHLGGPADRAVECGWLRLLLLNNSRTDSHDGFVSDGQIEWIDRQCKEAERQDQFVVFCLHVPVHANKHPDRGWYVKPEHGQTKLYEAVARHRARVLAFFHGHFHNGIRGWNDREQLHEICFPSALYNLDRRLEEQNAGGYNPLEFRPGFTLVTFAEGAMRLRYKPLGADDGVEKDLALAEKQ